MSCCFLCPQAHTCYIMCISTYMYVCLLMFTDPYEFISDSRPSSPWCHPAISSSVVPFSSCPQSLPASGSSQMSQLFASGGQSIGVSASTSVLPMNTQDWSPLGWTGWISLQSCTYNLIKRYIYIYMYLNKLFSLVINLFKLSISTMVNFGNLHFPRKLGIFDRHYSV